MTNTATHPRVLLTPGEPAGIGPDVALALAARPFPGELVACADPTILSARARHLNLDIKIREADGSVHRPGCLNVLPVTAPEPVVPGRLNPANAAYVVETLTTATRLCQAGDFDALCTAPVHKAVINDAGVAFTGHTELLATLTQSPQPVMLLAAADLRVALATTHISLAEVSAAITRARLNAVIDVTLRDLERLFNLPQPRLVVCGLNPHAGEGGHLGREEIDTIEPVVADFRARGHNVSGPVPADTAFTKENLAHADAVLAMFHDQGLPVVKHQGFGEAVNVTLGIPIVRTSVDHGTALDLAGTGRANAGSLHAALMLALKLARNVKRRG